MWFSEKHRIETGLPSQGAITREQRMEEVSWGGSVRTLQTVYLKRWKEENPASMFMTSESQDKK